VWEDKRPKIARSALAVGTTIQAGVLGGEMKDVLLPEVYAPRSQGHSGRGCFFGQAAPTTALQRPSQSALGIEVATVTAEPEPRGEGVIEGEYQQM
jgi:hypothetical protein